MGEWNLFDCELAPSKTWGFHGVDIRPLESHPGNHMVGFSAILGIQQMKHTGCTSSIYILNGCKIAVCHLTQLPELSNVSVYIKYWQISEQARYMQLS